MFGSNTVPSLLLLPIGVHRQNRLMLEVACKNAAKKK